MKKKFLLMLVSTKPNRCVACGPVSESINMAAAIKQMIHWSMWNKFDANGHYQISENSFYHIVEVYDTVIP